MRSRLALIVLIAIALAASVPVLAQTFSDEFPPPTEPVPTTRIFLSLTGETQGDIEGDATFPGEEGSTEIIGFSHEITSPRDAASGLPTGKRQHKPFVVTKPTDKTTPILYTSLTQNEVIEGVFRFYRPSPVDGTMEHFYTIKLTGGRIAGVHSESSKDTGHQPQEELVIVYKTISWTWEPTGATATDDWQTNRRGKK